MPDAPNVLRRIRYTFETLGFRRTVRDLLPKQPVDEDAADRTFDALHGTSTAGTVAPADLGIDEGLSRSAAILYMPSPQRVTNWMLDRCGVQPGTTTFVDLGCGKGRVVLTAALRPFHQVVGVEISTALVAIARANVEAYRPPAELLAPIEIVRADATPLDLPDGDLLIHLYHPFETPVTDLVMERLEASLQRSPRHVTIAYLAYTEAIPRVREVFARFPWLREVRYEQSLRGHYNWLLMASRDGQGRRGGS
jgi:SAM-dependent methyltransferase